MQIKRDAVLSGARVKSSNPRQATPVDEAIGLQIRKRRRMLGMSQLDLAVTVGIASQQIQKYEIGVNRISVSRLVEIAAALDAPVAWFFQNVAASSANKVASGAAMDAGKPASTAEGVVTLSPAPARKSSRSPADTHR